MAIRRVRKDDLENELNKGAMWAVTYGDMMSYLMIFFLVLFSFSLARADKKQSKRYEESLANIQKSFGGKVDEKRLQRAVAQEKEERIADNLKESIAASDMSKFVTVQSSENKIKLVLSEPILFDSAQAKLKDAAKPVLDTIIKEVKGMPNNVVIEGYTDNMPIIGGRFESNWELSMYRAYAVVKYFEQNGIAPEKLAAIGYGEYKPAGDNSTKEGRAKNRRIEIALIKTQ